MRFYLIIIYAVFGTCALRHGAQNASHGWIAIALIMLCMALGLIISSHTATQIIRGHIRAIWFALIIRRLLRRRA